jgi:hypothetical protein
VPLNPGRKENEGAGPQKGDLLSPGKAVLLLAGTAAFPPNILELHPYFINSFQKICKTACTLSASLDQTQELVNKTSY